MQKLYERIFGHPVFHLREMEAVVPEWTPKTARRRLSDLVRQRRVGRVAYGVYFVVPPGKTPETTSVDPYLVGARLAQDAILAYHTALELLGTAYSAARVVHYVSARYRKPFTWRGIEFRQVKPPESLVRAKAERIAVTTQERDGRPVSYTNRERTLVDCVHRLDLAGGFEELLRSVEGWPTADPEEALRYLTVLDKVSLFAKVGYIMETLAERWGLTESDLQRLRSFIPRGTVYLTSSREPNRYVSRWNLMVPSRLTDLTT